jgi:hypothetical protein
VVTRLIARGYNSDMRNLALLLLLTVALAACGDVVIGPVDHSCAARPQKGPDGSGCGPARG